jgi:hypothetical protein
MACSQDQRWKCQNKSQLHSTAMAHETAADQTGSEPQIYPVRFEVFTAVTMKNVVFWDIKTHFVLHRIHITSPLQSPASKCYVRFEVFMAVTMKNVVFCDIKTHFVLHRRHITSPLQSPAS